MHSPGNLRDLARAVKLVDFAHLLMRQDYPVVLSFSSSASALSNWRAAETRHLNEIAGNRSIRVLDICGAVAWN